MQFDSVMLAAIAREMQPLVGARVRDIWTGRGTGAESEKAEPRALYLLFGDATLLIDTHPHRARAHLVANAPPGGTPTPFADAARRALRGARLVSISQPAFDRVLHLRFTARDAIGNAQKYTLVAELMDRRSNAILLDEDFVIIDALKRLPPFLNRARTVLPHRPYEPPPLARRDPREEHWPQFFQRSTVEFDRTPSIEQWRELLHEFNGISPLLLRHLQTQTARGVAPEDALQRAFSPNEARVYRCEAQPYPLELGGCETQGETWSALLEKTIESAAAKQEVTEKRAALGGHLARLEKRVAAQRLDWQRARAHADEAARWQEQGNLVLAHLREVGEAAARGAKHIELEGESGAMQIPIEPKWPPADNATRLFNRAKRARKLALHAPEREMELDAEAARLAELRRRFETLADARDLEFLARDAGYEAATKTVSRSRQQQTADRPESKLRRVEIEGWICFQGRNADENQMLLSKVARPSDIWMHVRGRPSAHVLVKNQKGKTPPPEVLDEAARWLAISSLARKTSATGERVEIIYTQSKWVRAVKGAPGKVTLQRSQTRLVTI